jgi:purine catabolism regulator
VAMTLAEVLELDIFRRSRPEVVVGADQLDRPVRWVHTSELAEAAYLLKGGELLLTTGLGLAGRGAVGESAYVAALAERGTAALALELGWTFLEPPRALVEACRRHGLPLMVLHNVVPFVEIAEQVQTALMEKSGTAARLEREVRQVLADALLDGAGSQELTSILAELVSAPVTVTTVEGTLVAASGGDPGAPRRRVAPVIRRDVILLDRPWGHVSILPPARGDDPAVITACSYGAEALGLALLRSAAGGDLDLRRRRLVEDLTERHWRSPGELVGRARVLGLSFTAEGTYVALIITDLRPRDVEQVVRNVTAALPPGTALVAEVAEEVVAVIRTSGPIAAGQAVLQALDRFGESSARVVVGTVVNRLEDVDLSLSRARSAVDVPVRSQRLVFAAQLTAQLLLRNVRDHSLAEQLISEEIGRLAAYDAAHGTELVRTLRTYLSHASSKVRTAEALRLRRQTLYARLQRIEGLIGDVSAPHRHTALVVALALVDLAA